METVLRGLAWSSSSLEPYKTLIELFLTVTIGGATLYIARKQYQLEKLHARRELWDRRMAVYDEVYAFLNAISQSGGRVEPEVVKAFADATGESRLQLLFPDKRVREHVKEIRAKAEELWRVRALEGGLQAGEKQAAQTVRRQEIVLWMCSRSV